MRIIYIYIAILFISLTGASTGKGSDIPLAKEGVLDLRNWDFENNGNVRLDGEWEFYYGGFLSSKSFDTIQDRNFIKVPMPWNNYTWKGKTLPSMGYASYCLKVLINSKIKDIVFKVPDQASSFVMLINDSLAGLNGTIGYSKESSDPQYKPLIINYDNIGDTIDIIFYVSNYDWRYSGLVFSSQIGLREKLIMTDHNKSVIDYILAVIFCIFAYFLLNYFFVRREDKSTLYFALLSLAMCVRSITTSEKIIIDMFPDINWELLLKLEHISWYAFAVFVGYYFRALFKEEVSLRIVRISTVIASILIIITLLTPVSIFCRLVPFAQAWTLAYALYCIYADIIAIKHHREGGYLILFGFLVLIASAINEIMYYNYLAPLIISSPVGQFVFICTQLVLFAHKASGAINRVENFAQELEHTVTERTIEIIAQKDEIERSNKLLNESNTTKDKFFSIIAHDLRNPIQALILTSDVLVNYNDKINYKDLQNIYKALSKESRHLSMLLENLLEWSRSESGAINYSPEELNLLEIVKKNTSMLSNSFERKQIRLINNISDEIAVLSDSHMLMSILRNILTNAVKFSHKKGEIRLSASEIPANGKGIFIKISIADNGVGIPAENLKKLFRIDGSLSTRGTFEEKGTGLGLILCKEFVERHGGEIFVDSVPGAGSTFSFTLPSALNSAI